MTIPHRSSAAFLLSIALHVIVLVQLNMPNRSTCFSNQTKLTDLNVMLVSMPTIEKTTIVEKQTQTQSISAKEILVTKNKLIQQKTITQSEPTSDFTQHANTDSSPVENTMSNIDAETSLAISEKNSQQTPIQNAQPDYAHNPPPDYPMLLREQGIEGVVWLRVRVNNQGQPEEINLAKKSGYRLLDDAALRAVRGWRFIPARQGNQTIASWVEFSIRFSLSG